LLYIWPTTLTDFPIELPVLAGSNLDTGVLDTGVVSFFTSTGCITKAGALAAAGGALGVTGGLKGFGGSSSRRLFHIMPPS
jgi:hypothetical protein